MKSYYTKYTYSLELAIFIMLIKDEKKRIHLFALSLDRYFYLDRYNNIFIIVLQSLLHK